MLHRNIVFFCSKRSFNRYLEKFTFYSHFFLLSFCHSLSKLYLCVCYLFLKHCSVRVVLRDLFLTSLWSRQWSICHSQTSAISCVELHSYSTTPSLKTDQNKRSANWKEPYHKNQQPFWYLIKPLNNLFIILIKCLSIYLSVCLSICIYLAVCLSTSIYLSICLSVCLSVINNWLHSPYIFLM